MAFLVYYINFLFIKLAIFTIFSGINHIHYIV